MSLEASEGSRMDDESMVWGCEEVQLREMLAVYASVEFPAKRNAWSLRLFEAECDLARSSC